MTDDRSSPQLALGNSSIKRIAWAFGCAKRDSEEEAKLYRLLLSKVAERLALDAGWAIVPDKDGYP
jgi:hypothetical protein